MNTKIIPLQFAILITSIAGVANAQNEARPVQPPQPHADTLHEPTLTVTGHGEAEGVPDRATVRLGGEVQGADAIGAQNELNDNMAKVLTAIEAVGIDPKQIQTTNLSIYAVYANNNPNLTPMANGEPQAPKIIAYRASETLQIRVEDLLKLGKIVDAGIAAGANQMQGIAFELKNDLPERTSALTQAAHDARAKAEALAAALNVSIVGITEIDEGGVNVQSPQPVYAMRSAAMAPTQVQTGELKVQATVTVRYRIAPGANVGF